jgi:predicted nuclease of predicted toxin-antitoxin system
VSDVAPSRLFINLYLDEDVSVLVATLVRARAFSAMTTVQAGQRGKSDREQLAFSAEHQMAIVTHNRVDFERLAAEYTAAGKSHAGIIIAVRRSPYAIAQRLLALMNHLSADEMDGQVIYI